MREWERRRGTRDEKKLTTKWSVADACCCAEFPPPFREAISKSVKNVDRGRNEIKHIIIIFIRLIALEMIGAADWFNRMLKIDLNGFGLFERD